MNKKNYQKSKKNLIKSDLLEIPMNIQLKLNVYMYTKKYQSKDIDNLSFKK